MTNRFVFNNADKVGVPYGAQSMGDDEHSSSFHCPIQCLTHLERVSEFDRVDAKLQQLTSRSLSVSRALVASSNTNIGGSFSNALAIAIL